jgi:hypothetical protein
MHGATIKKEIKKTFKPHGVTSLKTVFQIEFQAFSCTD